MGTVRNVYHDGRRMGKGRHCEEHSDEAIQPSYICWIAALPSVARNDGGNACERTHSIAAPAPALPVTAPDDPESTG
jgi:hypothetical protein